MFGKLKMPFLGRAFFHCCRGRIRTSTEQLAKAQC